MPQRARSDTHFTYKQIKYAPCSHQHTGRLPPKVAAALSGLPGPAFDDPTVNNSAQAFADALLGEAARRHVPGLLPTCAAAPPGVPGNCVAVTVNATVGVHSDIHDMATACILFARSGEGCAALCACCAPAVRLLCGCCVPAVCLLCACCVPAVCLLCAYGCCPPPLPCCAFSHAVTHS